MKRNKFHINARTLNIALLAFCALALSSCLKDKAPGDENYSHSPALVGFQFKGFGSVPLVASVFGTPDDTLSVELALSVASLTLSSPVTLTVVPTTAGLDSFNTASSPTDPYQELPASLYTLQGGGKITINPGQQKVTMLIKFAGDQIDFTKKNGVALRISDAQGAIIASNLNTAIVLLTLKSVYAGNYHCNGVRVHPVLGPFSFDYDADMSTVDANTITGSILADLQADLTLHINPDNSVTLSGVAFPPFPQAGKENKYDPATKTFTLNYYYNTGAPRLITETVKMN